MYPFIVPDQVTIWDAAALQSSQLFMLIGAGIMLPLILGYTGSGLLGVPRQGRRPRLSLTTGGERPLWRVLAWMVVIWTLSVGALGVVATILGVWLGG